MRSDPKRRRDGKCIVCSKQKKLPKTPPSPTISAMIYELDPFCSSTCCRMYYGNPIPSMSGYLNQR